MHVFNLPYFFLWRGGGKAGLGEGNWYANTIFIHIYKTGFYLSKIISKMKINLVRWICIFEDVGKETCFVSG